MNKTTIAVSNLPDQRRAYEVESYLKGVPYVSDVRVDFLSDQVTVWYDDGEVTRDTVLDELQNAGCTPDKRVTGVVGRIKSNLFGRKV